MSICAEMIGSIRNDDGTVDLLLGPIGDDGPGQNHLKVLNPPVDVETFCKAVAFEKIWGGSSEIMIRETKWADRVGYERIRLVESAAVQSEPSKKEADNE